MDQQQSWTTTESSSCMNTGKWPWHEWCYIVTTQPPRDYEKNPFQSRHGTICKAPDSRDLPNPTLTESMSLHGHVVWKNESRIVLKAKHLWVSWSLTDTGLSLSMALRVRHFFPRAPGLGPGGRILRSVSEVGELLCNWIHFSTTYIFNVTDWMSRWNHRGAPSAYLSIDLNVSTVSRTVTSTRLCSYPRDFLTDGWGCLSETLNLSSSFALAWTLLT